MPILPWVSIDVKRRTILVEDGKGAKDRIVYMSNDALHALAAYLRVRPASGARKIFLVEKGTCTGQPISIRGIQKRMEYYARKAKIRVSCHHLRHTMATQMLNADADLSTIQDLLGHSNVKTTQRYCRISNLKVQRDYFNAMEVIMQQTVGNPNSIQSEMEALARRSYPQSPPPCSARRGYISWGLNVAIQNQ